MSSIFWHICIVEHNSCENQLVPSNRSSTISADHNLHVLLRISYQSVQVPDKMRGSDFSVAFPGSEFAVRFKDGESLPNSPKFFDASNLLKFLNSDFRSRLFSRLDISFDVSGVAFVLDSVNPPTVSELLGSFSPESTMLTLPSPTTPF